MPSEVKEMPVEKTHWDSVILVPTVGFYEQPLLGAAVKLLMLKRSTGLCCQS